MSRTNQDIFESHLDFRKAGDVEKDIQENFGEDVVIVTSVSTFVGHQGVRESATVLKQDIPNATFEYVKKEVVGDFAYLIWKADSESHKVEHGVDSFLIRDGKIRVQSIFYVVEKTE